MYVSVDIIEYIALEEIFMISKISVEDRNLNSVRTNIAHKNQNAQNPAFKGGIWSLALQGLQECEKNPMVNVAVIDLLSAILPRTVVESMTNWFAGFEAFRRESSGLIVNCLIPGFITMGVAAGLNKFIMPKGVKMARCWADGDLINRTTEIYQQSKSTDKVKDTLKQILANVEGFEGKSKIRFGDVLTEKELEKYASRLKELTISEKSNKEIDKAIKEITKEITEKTHVFENLKVGGGKNTVKASTINSLMEDSVKFFKGFQKAGSEMSMQDFAKKSKSLVKSKSILGLLIVLPLAASMQYINRWITEKMSGVKGAPIYDDFTKKDQDEQKQQIREKSKEGLLKQKIISISSMIGVGLLSMMKRPSWNMFEFKGQFPTMDQARIISTTTFASRMAAADDKNELAEATTRDIATFLSLYFLGDYAAKGTATIIENKTGVRLLNDTKPIAKDANIFKKFAHWMKDLTLKSSEEVVSNTAEKLKAQGLTPTAEQKEIIEKELKRAVNLRSACQVANLGVSLILLGLIIPIWTRRSTKKKHAEAIRQAQSNVSSNVNVDKDVSTSSSATVTKKKVA